jgi:lysophospholipase L1-like esterase
MQLRLIAIITLLIIISSCQKKDKVLVIVRGDSFADGIGSSGTSSSAEFYKGTQVQGDSTWGKQLQVLLDKREDYRYEVDMVGYPGQTSAWFLKSNELPAVKKKIADAANDYKYIIFCAEFGTNDEANPGVNDNTSVDSLINNIAAINQSIKGIPGTNGKLYILGYPLTRRIDKFTQRNSNIFRNRYNLKIIGDPSLIKSDVVMDYRKNSALYDDRAPQGPKFSKSDVDHLSGVHPNDEGYKQLAIMVGDVIVEILNKKQ